MASQEVFIGRTWPTMPTWVRITVGSEDEMQRFQIAWQRVMNSTAIGKVPQNKKSSRIHLDGTVIPA
jgi:histidinol-phosphate aminotransferase